MACMRLQPADLLLDPRSAWSSTWHPTRIRVTSRTESARCDKGKKQESGATADLRDQAWCSGRWYLFDSCPRTAKSCSSMEHAFRVDNLHEDKGMHARRTFSINKLLIQSRAIASEMTSVIS